MNEKAIRDAVIAVLRKIAPEFDPNGFDEAAPLRDQIDLDSVDWLNVLVGLNERLHVDIPERDYERLRTFADLVSYLAAKLTT